MHLLRGLSSTRAGLNPGRGRVSHRPHSLATGQEGDRSGHRAGWSLPRTPRRRSREVLECPQTLGVSRPRQWLVRGHAAHWRVRDSVPWATVPEAGLPCPVLPCPLGRPAITIAAQGAVGSGPRAAWGRGDVRPLSPPDISGAASPRKPRPALRHRGPGLPCREGASCLGRPREVADPRGGDRNSESSLLPPPAPGSPGLLQPPESVLGAVRGLPACVACG